LQELEISKPFDKIMGKVVFQNSERRRGGTICQNPGGRGAKLEPIFPNPSEK